MPAVLEFLFLFGFYSIERISVFSSLSLFFSPSSSFFPSGDGDVHRIDYTTRKKNYACDSIKYKEEKTRKGIAFIDKKTFA
jgi:hypothetical protein